MKKLLFLPVLLCTITTNAQVYLISFSGTGASTTVGSVKVENMTAGTSLTLYGGNILRLNILTGIDPVRSKQSSGLKIYPNPSTGNSVLQIYPPVEGNADIKVFDMTGREVAQMRSHLENSLQEFRLSGLQSGLYMISVTGNSYSFSGKLISNGNPSGQVSIGKLSSNLAAEEKPSKTKSTKGVQDYFDMPYSVGDRIKFTGISGNYSTVKTDIPTGDKTITFNFISCTDGDNNNYPVVEIGNQIWMAENLKTIKFNDGTAISLITNDYSWGDLTIPGYCWYNNNGPATENLNGALYNWYAVGKGNLCPTGWHVPGDIEWTALTDHLTNNGYGYEGSGNDIAKSMAVTSGWTASTTAGNVGNNQVSNNSSGFSAFSAGFRDVLYRFGEYVAYFYSQKDYCSWWSSTESGEDVYTITMGYDMNYVNGSLNRNKKNGFSIRCIKTEGFELPELSTTAVSLITVNSATGGGEVMNDGGSTITARGVCWSTSSNPTLADSKTSDGTGTGPFISSLTGLEAKTTYFTRAYVTNSLGTSFGNEVVFTTKPHLITTIVPTSIRQTTVSSGGNISDDGEISVTARGVCWSVSSNPTIADNYSSDGTGTGIYVSKISGLEPNTKYYLRAYVTYNEVTSYGNEILFATRGASGTLSDADGNTYLTIEIGTQTWMAENLKTTHCNDGTYIPNEFLFSRWSDLTTPGYVWPGDLPGNKDTYGALYNWYTVNTGKLCPTGWHVPSDDEWSTLITYVGGVGLAGGKLKEASTLHWQSPNEGATNENGFRALPAGIKFAAGNGFSPGTTCYLWSSTKFNYSYVYAWKLFYDQFSAERVNTGINSGLSVRCLRDN